MTTPVFVLHGIGNRNEAAFTTAVDGLSKRAGGLGAHPIYWGDLGAKYDHLADTIPGTRTDSEVRDLEPDTKNDVLALAEFMLAGGASGRNEVRDEIEVPEPVLAAATATFELNAGDAEIRDDAAVAMTAAEVRAAIAEHWSTTKWLQLIDDPELQSAVGAAITAPIAEGGIPIVGGEAELRDEEIRGIDVVGFIRRRLQDLDRVVGAGVAAAAGRINTQLRSKVLPGIAQSAGDIIVYQRHRERIRDRVMSVIAKLDPELGRHPDRPVDVLAHSLGGVIAVDMATATDPLWIRSLVTFGSQSPFFHVCDPRGGQLEPYAGAPVTLPKSIGKWTNLWEPLDPLAFIAERVFQLNDGTKPVDVKVDHLASSGIWTHTDYWELDDVAKAVRTALSAT